MSLHEHIPMEHRPANINDVHRSERAEQEGFNQHIADVLTTRVGTMICAYIFVAIAVIGLLGVLNILPAEVYLLVAWASQTFIQLVMLPVIMVSQNVINRKQELQADEQFATTKKIYHDIEQIAQHQAKQDEVLIQLRSILEKDQSVARVLMNVEMLSRRQSEQKALLEQIAQKLGIGV